MTLSPGARFGPYEIQSVLGIGGMGEVYRARDTQLNRDVAIKVLPAEFATDGERLARFKREAQVLASFSHPNIASIYGFETSNETQALVLELVEGETLADRIARGRIPLDETILIARQICDALATAHEHGIIHRDLKPSNIRVTPDGAVKVLDFGLAKLTDPNVSNTPNAVSMSPTITAPSMMTAGGVILGTAAYMAPEQAKGRAADKRSDIWAMGCVLFEMLSGKRAFDGEDMVDVLSRVLQREPEWAALPAGVPTPIVTLLRSCLEKERRRRAADIGAAMFVLNHTSQLVERVEAPVAAPPPAVAPAPGPWRRMIPVAAALAAGALLAGIGVWLLTRPAAPSVVRTTIMTSGSTALALAGSTDRDIVITPDGSRIVYRGTNQLLVRALNQFEPTVLSGLGSPRGVFISPDGQWIGFFDGRDYQLKKVAITGGPPVIIMTRVNTAPRGATWGPDGTIIFATAEPATGLQRVSASGGDPTVLTRPDRAHGESDHFWPEFLPGGRAVLFTIIPVQGGLDNAQIAVIDLSTGVFKVVVRGGYDAHYLPTGHLLYGTGGTLRAVAFDLDRLEALGSPVPVLQNVLTVGQGALDATVAANGTLVYVPGSLGPGQRSLVWKTRAGGEEPVPAPARAYESLQLSPDGSRAVIQIEDQERDIWVWNFARQTLTRLTFSPDNDYDPAWTPDGRRVVFSHAGSLFWRAADGTGVEERLTTSAGMLPTSFSPDGKQLIVWEQNDIKLLTMDGKRVTPLVQTMFREARAYLSPDGRWLAYESDESDQNEIYVQPFPQLGTGRWQVSPTGGTDPAWSRNGRELFYLDGEGALVTVPIQTQPVFSAGKPTKLFDGPYYPVSGTRRFDVTADGQRFLFIKNNADRSALSATPNLVVIQNWTEELKRLVPRN
jgi:protein kinase-like protein/WD40 repeat protein